jgi:hypothetical protein
MDQLSTLGDPAPTGARPGTLAEPSTTGPAGAPAAERTGGPAADPPIAQAPAGRGDRWGWFGVAAITALVAATWAPQLTLPFGDNHFGRIFARHALHLRNFQEKGLVESGFTADWSPYVSALYAHHPPLLNLLDVLFGALPGSGAHEILIGPYLLGLLVVPAAAALLRGFGISWTGTLLAIGVMVATGFFWLYSPLMFDMGLILGLSASIVHLRRRGRPSRRLVLVACGFALLTTLASWPGIALAAVLGLWLLAARRFDRATIAVGTSMVVGVALSLAFVVGVSGMELITSQTEYRTAGGDFTAREFLARQFRFASALLPVWYFVLLPLGVVAGLLDRRTRFYVALATAFAAGWVILLNNGSYIHDYWAYPVLIPGAVGMGVLADRIGTRIPPRALTAGAVVAGLGLTVAAGTLVLGPTGRNAVYRPADAGRLIAGHPPAPGQESAWAPGISAPRWVAYYWDLPPRTLDQQSLVDQAKPDDLVLIRLDRRPSWIPGSAVANPVAREGRYALVRVSDIRAALGT